MDEPMTDEERIEALAAKYPGLGGGCGFCQKGVTNSDPDHRVTPVLEGGRGVECKLRGDYT